ncbi:GNAT family N-acetyltransferase [Devosia chinhatensis]|uniref:Acetyltransferase n=1 Tax=Devosia chinhatensis TaxID=429727 RepID=A0A0F5FHC0_9HYPH|nr:GNAT family N-acetyltransferase [Devosia chinhatensis]KKB07582.1 acetyltransferase [Devosia chinhatensis]
MTDVPTIVTQRLELRPMVMADFENYRALMMSDRARFMGGPYDLRSAWGMFTNDVAQWALFGHGCLMIQRRGDSACLGQVGINHGPLFPEKELGWLLYEGYEGHGYAFEAASALRAWAFGTLTIHHLVSYCDPENARSIALAQRLGGVLDVQAVGQDPRDLVFRYRAG